MSEQKIEPGQVWRRKSNGRLVRIEQVRHLGGMDHGVDVTWRGADGHGRGNIFGDNLRERYELVPATPSTDKEQKSDDAR